MIPGTYHTAPLSATQRRTSATNSGIVSLCESCNVLGQCTRLDHPLVPLWVERQGSDNVLLHALVQQPRLLVTKCDLDAGTHLTGSRNVLDLSQDGLQERRLPRADADPC